VRWSCWLLLQANLLAGGDFVGSAACGECHADHVGRQSSTNHALALRPILETGLPILLSERPVRERGGAQLEYRRVEHGLLVAATRSGAHAEGLLEWAFGAGSQGVTPVGLLGSLYFEHRISYYTIPKRLSLTMGHPGGPSRDAAAALGLPQEASTIQRCFSCHGTNVQPGPDLSRMEAGVRCERCHGPGRDHIVAAREKRPTADIIHTLLNPGRYPAKAAVQICGECHRAPAERKISATPEIDDPISVRFQPVGFLASKCFLGSKNFSCMTCHDPHENSRRNDDTFFSVKCAGCHQTNPKASSHCYRQTKRNCLPCHMQRLSPVSYLMFTDHRIRIY